MNLKRIRALHLYLGILFAPSLIFFAFSGSLQLFGLHEAERGSTSQPPRWIVALANVHKDQKVLDAPRAPETKPVRAKQPADPGSAPDAQGPAGKRHEPSLALKWFFCLAAACLILSSILGIVMAFQYNRDRRIIWTLLVAGVLLPIASLFL